MEENKPPQDLSTSQHKKKGINLPLDLAIDILRRLPAKSLARSRCVSKQWETVIGDYIVKNSIVSGREVICGEIEIRIEIKTKSERDRGLWYRTAMVVTSGGGGGGDE
ncbi:hypothetical protein F2Q68_00032913 [Brassica cretica]|uniref:F-box domain-containing protein n=1 Tax=Brassica cretica TaxID=69181 RepID=A0A8S9GKF6_BRACR|nr:hypothetical protein F2Q68_00032913 [Brassica cretica]